MNYWAGKLKKKASKWKLDLTIYILAVEFEFFSLFKPFKHKECFVNR